MLRRVVRMRGGLVCFEVVRMSLSCAFGLAFSCSFSCGEFFSYLILFEAFWFAFFHFCKYISVFSIRIP